MTPLLPAAPALAALLLALPVLLVLVPPAAAAAAVVGIDIGAKFIKVALVQSGAPLDIVLSPESGRKTEFVLQFMPNRKRAFGWPASINAARYPVSTFFNLKTLLGHVVLSPEAKQYAADFGVTVSPDPDPSRPLRLHLDDTPDSDSFHVDLMFAMMFEKIRLMSINAIKNLPYREKIDFLDAVVTIPAYFDQSERMVLLDAAKAAKLNVLRLMHDNTAVAINYGATNLKNERQTVIIYDMGAASSTASLITIDKSSKYKPMSIKVHKTACVDSFGGYTVDSVLADMLKRRFIAESKDPEATRVELAGIRNAGVRLRNEAERIKVVLSASTEAKAYIEHLTKTQTLKFTIKRAALEKELEKFKEKFMTPILSVVDAARELVLANAAKTKSAAKKATTSAAADSASNNSTNSTINANSTSNVNGNQTNSSTNSNAETNSDNNTDDDDDGTEDYAVPAASADANAQRPAASNEKGEIYVNSILLFGGALRIPLIQRWIESIPHIARTSRTINGDEASAFGAALYGATLSPLFRIQKSKVFDVLPYEFGLYVDGNGADADATNYAAVKPVKGMWRLAASTTIEIPGSALPAKPGNSTFTLRTRGGKKLGNLEIANAATKGKIKTYAIRFFLNENGFLTVRNVTRVIETTVMLVSSRRETENVTFTYTSHVVAMSQERVAELVATLKVWSDREREETEMEDLHNSFESLVYDLQSKLLDNNLLKLSTASEREAIEVIRRKAAEWLENSAPSATKAQIEEQLDSLRLAFLPLWNRVEEWTKLINDAIIDARFLNDSEKITVINNFENAETYNVVELRQAAAEIRASVVAFKEEERKKREQERIERERVLAELRKVEEELKKKMIEEAKAAKEAAAKKNATESADAANNTTATEASAGDATASDSGTTPRVDGDDFEPEKFDATAAGDADKDNGSNPAAEDNEKPEKAEL